MGERDSAAPGTSEQALGIYACHDVPLERGRTFPEQEDANEVEPATHGAASGHPCLQWDVMN